MTDHALRDNVIYLLNGGGAHLEFEKVIAGLPVELRGPGSGIPISPFGVSGGGPRGDRLHPERTRLRGEGVRACECFADLLRAPPNPLSRLCGSST